jgi:hypothetical protein
MTRYITTEVEVELSDFDTDDLLEELEIRGHDMGSGPGPFDSKELLEKIWMKRRLGNHNYQTELDQLIYGVLGKVI